MTDVDEIRRKLGSALKARGVGAVALATRLGLDRTYISDFVRGKKRSLGAAETSAIAEALELPLRELTPDLEKVATIRKGARPHLYISEHMEDRGLDDEAMSRRTDGIPAEMIAKWRSNPAKLQDWQVAALLHALDMDEAELTRLPAKRLKAAPSRKVRKTA
jgi:transcriptional regulator with XRE-family HTH domain